jgi:hypothetical protein
MRAIEFISEDRDPNFSENNLINGLETVRNRFQDTGEEPKVSLRAIVTMVRNMPGSEMFNVDSLKSIYDKSQKVKNLIASVKDDETGVKTVFLKPASTAFDDPDLDINGPATGDSDIGSNGSPQGGPEATVGKMAKRAASKRN